jgi:hypothetical protein
MPAIDRVKLRMKIGVHEFEAEGPRDLVIAQLDIWMRAAGLATTPAGDATAAAGDHAGRSPAARDFRPERHPGLGDVFRVDAERQLIILRVRVNGRRRNADAALVLLHGFDTCFGTGDGADVPAVRLRAALAASGHRLRRMDRALAPYVAAGLVHKGGRHKHETYALTAPGSRHAAALVRRFAPPPDGNGPAKTAGDLPRDGADTAATKNDTAQ